MSKIYSALVGKNIRVYVADSTDLVKEAVRLHKTSPVSSKAFGRTLTATSLIGKLLKNKKDVLTLKIAGTNQIKAILATADFEGHVKGYISNTQAELPFKSDTNQIGEAIGRAGSVTIIRDFGLKEPYVGISHMINAEIDDDIAFYFRNSEQQPTVLELNVHVEGDEVVAAGGILIQPLPDADLKEKAAVDFAKEKIHNITELIEAGTPVEAIIKSYFTDLDVRMTGEFPVEFKCDCNIDRITKALVTVGVDELTAMKNEDKGAQLMCHFCNKAYKFSEKELEDIIEAMNG